MKYEKLTTEQQQQMVEAKLHQLESEHFNHQMLLDQYRASGDTSEPMLAAIKASEDALKTLDAAHAEVKKKAKAAK